MPENFTRRQIGEIRRPERRPARRNGRRNNKSLLPLAVISLIILLAGGYFWYQNARYEYILATPVDAADTKNMSLIIKDGDNPVQIAGKLTDKKLIADEGAFTRYLKEKSLDRKIVAGRFLLSRSQTIPQIAENITNNQNSQSIVTITEGSTISGIDDKLAGLNLIQSGDFINAAKNFSGYDKYPFLDKQKIGKLIYPLEGYLFPDTYFVDSLNFKSEELISMMLNNFEKKTAEFNSIPLEILGEKRSFYDLIVMASMVEKEVRTAKDLPIVAGIIWKRYDSNWMLGIDAALLYINDGDREISYNDLQQDTPYNTRKKTGLPPGPICNPGISSIEAALNPKETPYFYYLTKPDSGEVVYAATNDEHNRNKAQYLN
jgi:UPF0755 protein